jgi:hypothetical protein
MLSKEITNISADVFSLRSSGYINPSMIYMELSGHQDYALHAVRCADSWIGRTLQVNQEGKS